VPALEERPDTSPEITAAEYIKDNFEPTDRLAVLVHGRQTNETIQRIVTAEAIAGSRYQGWLRHMNAEGFDIYISQNSLVDSADHRRKVDVAAIRHVYLDLDQNGDQSLAAIQSSDRVPKPNYVLNTSPGKYQVIWKVRDMTPEQAEALQRTMVSQFGGDPAATDSTRVLRLPGFFNKKYEESYRVQVEKLSDEVYRPRDFGLAQSQDISNRPQQTASASTSPRSQSSQSKHTASEHDWSWVMRKLQHGESMETLIEKLADYRDTKPNPEYYARRTVTKAYAHVAIARGDDPEQVIREISAFPPRSYENGEAYARTTVQQAIENPGRGRLPEHARHMKESQPREQRDLSQQQSLGAMS
jgi:RepB DNA-primase N-terminal domain